MRCFKPEKTEDTQMQKLLDAILSLTMKNVTIVCSAVKQKHFVNNL